MSATDLRHRARRRHRARCGRAYTGHRPGWALVAVSVVRVQDDGSVRVASIPHFMRQREDRRPHPHGGGGARDFERDTSRERPICWPVHEARAIADRINARAEGNEIRVNGHTYRQLAAVVRCW